MMSELHNAQHRPPHAGASPDVTHLLNAAGAGDPKAPAELLALVYQQLRAIAQKRMNAEHPGHTLQATALVHEAYAKLVGRDAGSPNADGAQSNVAWNGRAHFFHAAAEAMRRILVDHARAKRAGLKDGQGALGAPRRPLRMPANVLDLAQDQDPDSVLALDEALARLSKVDEQTAMVVRLRFFAGRSVDETALALGISPRQVDREWAFARAWLAEALAHADHGPKAS